VKREGTEGGPSSSPEESGRKRKKKFEELKARQEKIKAVVGISAI